ncbi:inositol 1,4,5-triphosphate receptor associated 1-like isoform X2 [Stegodyphus dumicola]|uniref:inositol 1,4,5-triphosphate receptor associated 1-like isoform X2 n=1 Tax=Stegodyphus dumicola TaxID=202533 RepID=UPI0015A78F3C|nr:inositol 1,4,5-triphosphate receptor associated 1-like isoform X2 [Stegodyphus dumicola]
MSILLHSRQFSYFSVPVKFSRLENTEGEKNDPERSSFTQVSALTGDNIKCESESSNVEDKNGFKDNFKPFQRSMRRRSGPGCLNSQLSFCRYPAFDFGGREDENSNLPSPVESEGNHTVKDEILQGIKVAEKAGDNDSNLRPSRSKDTSQRNRDASESKTLIPELKENSETESTKDSFESEAPNLSPSVGVLCLPVPDIAFPSIPNTFLAKLGVHKDSPLSVEAFDEQELESKFIALSLAFKTDRTTLNKRLDVNKRQRDTAEKNVEIEFQAMRENLNILNLKASSPDIRDVISKIQNHIDVAQQATFRMSSRSETYGSVQQEERVSRAFEVLVLYVDHLKRLFDKEHKELEETRRMLTDTRVFRKDITTDGISDDQKKYLRTFGLPAGSIKSIGRRRASVADFHQHSMPESCKPPGLSQSWTSGFCMMKESKQRTPGPFPTTCVGLSGSSLPTSPITSISPSRTGTIRVNARRRSLPAASPMAPQNMLQNLEVPPDVPAPKPLQYLSVDKQLTGKKDRNVWTRKLSSVTDEAEQSEDETEAKENDEDTKDINLSSSERVGDNVQDDADIEDQSDEIESQGELNSVGDSGIFKIIPQNNILLNFRNSVSEWLHIQNISMEYGNELHRIWHQNSTRTLVQYSASGLLICIAFYFFLSEIIPYILFPA